MVGEGAEVQHSLTPEDLADSLGTVTAGRQVAGTGSKKGPAEDGHSLGLDIPWPDKSP